MIEKVKAVIEKVRPYIQRDGGDIEFLSVDEHGFVFVKMHGACADCMSIDSTIKDGLEVILMDEVEGVKGVIVDDHPYF